MFSANLILSCKVKLGQSSANQTCRSARLTVGRGPVKTCLTFSHHEKLESSKAGIHIASIAALINKFCMQFEPQRW